MQGLIWGGLGCLAPPQAFPPACLASLCMQLLMVMVMVVVGPPSAGLDLCMQVLRWA